MGTITSSTTTMLPGTELLLSRNNLRHIMPSVHCAKSPDKAHFWANIKCDLSRNMQRNVLEFEITIHDILNESPTKSFLQLVQSMPRRVQDCLRARGRYTRCDVFRNIIMQCCYTMYCLYFCCSCILFREMLHN